MAESNEFWRTAVDWVEAEHASYESNKFSRERDDLKTASAWEDRITMYLHRARVLGLDNPLGRQAVGKAATTAVAYLESMFRRFDTVPSPGFTSGEHKGSWTGGEHHDPTEETQRADSSDH